MPDMPDITDIPHQNTTRSPVIWDDGASWVIVCFQEAALKAMPEWMGMVTGCLLVPSRKSAASGRNSRGTGNMRDEGYLEAFASGFRTLDTAPERGRQRPFVRAKVGDPGKAIITSNRPVEVLKHFHKSISYPCSGKRDCPLCLLHISKRFFAYLAGLTKQNKEECFIEMTKNCVLSCRQLIDTKCDLRGSNITLYRKGTTEHAPVQAEVTSFYTGQALERLPQPFDLVRALLEVWGNPFELARQIGGKTYGEGEQEQSGEREEKGSR